jgi:hypothetical protein
MSFARTAATTNRRISQNIFVRHDEIFARAACPAGGQFHSITEIATQQSKDVVSQSDSLRKPSDFTFSRGYLVGGVYV